MHTKAHTIKLEAKGKCGKKKLYQILFRNLNKISPKSKESVIKYFKQPKKLWAAWGNLGIPFTCCPENGHFGEILRNVFQYAQKPFGSLGIFILPNKLKFFRIWAFRGCSKNIGHF
jgi:hypothetical protein